jgi:hypothetical protein
MFHPEPPLEAVMIFYGIAASSCSYASRASVGLFKAVHHIPVKVFCVVMPCSDVVGCQHFWGPSKHWYPTATLHGITFQKTLN